MDAVGIVFTDFVVISPVEVMVTVPALPTARIPFDPSPSVVMAPDDVIEMLPLTPATPLLP